MTGAADRRRPRPKQPHGPATVPTRLRPERAGATAPRLLERDDYLSELRALFSEDWGHPVGPIVVEGGTGVGKTAFLKAACQIAVDAGWTVLRARGDGLKARAPFGVVSQLLSSQAGGATQETSVVDEPGDAVAELDRLVKKLSPPSRASSSPSTTPIGPTRSPANGSTTSSGAVTRRPG